MEHAYTPPARIREALTAQIPGITPGGAVLHREAGVNYCYTGDSHTLFIGETGTGKSSSGVSPLVYSCIEARENIIMVEPKDEHARHFRQALEENGYRVAKINFSNPSDPDSINCNLLTYPRRCYLSGDPILQNAGEDAMDSLAAGIWPITPQSSDPFWSIESRNMFRGGAQLLFDYAREEETTFAGIHALFANDTGTSLSGLRKVTAKLPADCTAARTLAGYLQAPAVTRGGLQSSFLARMLPYIRESFLALLGRDELHIDCLDPDTPTAVFIILPDQSDHCDALAGALVTQLISHYYYLSQTRYDSRLPRRVNVILEELGNIGKAIPQLHKYMSGARSRNIRLHLVLQDRSQLDSVYGPSLAGTILQNAGLVLQFRSNHWPTLQDMSQKMGSRHVMICGQAFTLPVITETQLAALSVGQALVNLQGRLKFVARLPHISSLISAPPPPAGNKPPRTSTAPPLFDIDALAKRMGKEHVPPNSARSRTETPEQNQPVRNICLPPRTALTQTASSAVFDATLIDAGEKRAELTFHIHRLTNIPCDTLIRGMRKLPYRILTGVSQHQAQTLQALVQQSGGICTVTQTGDPECSWMFE